jgi:hypothetical protein
MSQHAGHTGSRQIRSGSALRRCGAIAALVCALAPAPVLAQAPNATAPGQNSNPPQTTNALKLKAPDAGVRLLGANCRNRLTCWLSGVFAPTVVRDRVAAVPVINTSTESVQLSAKFIPTNGLAMGRPPGLTLQQVPAAAAPKDMLTNPAGIGPIPSGETAQLKLELDSSRVPAGLYTGQIQFTAAPTTGKAEPVTQITTVEVRIRDSAVWALLAVLLGILLGRVSQLVYDPKMIARVQLLDWIRQLEAEIARVPAGGQAALKQRLDNLRNRLFDRGADADALKAEVVALQKDVDDALNGAGIVPLRTVAPARTQATGPRAVGGQITNVLRILAGVSPLPLQSVYDWLLPVMLLVTLVVLTVVFMTQQYGGTGTAETFGAGGIADYAGLFLAGVASEAITGGLRAIKQG